MRKYEVSGGGIGTLVKPVPTHLAASLHFDSMASVRTTLGSPEGQAAAGDIANFSDGGADLYFFEDRTI